LETFILTEKPGPKTALGRLLVFILQ
jgi:hypothetical protein